MPLSRRTGHSLVELLVALVILGIVAGMAAMLRVQLEGRLRGRLERVGVATALRTAARVIHTELAPLGADSVSGGDLGTVGPGSVVYRAHRGVGVVCRIAPDSVWLAVAQLARWRSRTPVPARDSLLLFRAGASGLAQGWVPTALVAGPVTSPCPDGGGGLLYLTTLDSTALGTAGLPAATIGRWFETASLAAYSAAAGWQLGYAGLSAGAVVQPVAGPLAGLRGLTIAALDRSGAVVAPAGAGWLEIRLHGLTRRDLAAGGGRAGVAGDSLGIGLDLENHP